MDSYFSHYKTALLLFSNKFNFTMICPTNRLEPDCKSLLAGYKLRRGEWIGVTNGFYAAIQYKDKKKITFLSNEISLEGKKKVQSGKPGVKDLYEKRHVNVDVADRYAHMYPGCHRVTKWTQALWMGILRVILPNSWIFYKRATGIDLDYKEFLIQVSIDLARKGGANIDTEGNPTKDVHTMQYSHGHHCHKCNHYPTHYYCTQCGDITTVHNVVLGYVRSVLMIPVSDVVVPILNNSNLQ